MALMTEIRKNVTEYTPVMAVVGATDYAVERVRAAAVNAGHLQDEVEKVLAQLETMPQELQARVRKLDVKAMQQAPVIIVHRALELAGKVEEQYDELVVRGKELIERARQAPSTQDLIKQAKTTMSRARAAWTTARKALDDSAAAVLNVVSIGRREAAETAAGVEAEVADSVAATEKVLEQRTRGTRAAVRGAATTMRKRAASTRTATRSATTSARKTAKKAVTAVEKVAGQIGEEAPAAKAPAAAAPAAPAANGAAKAAPVATDAGSADAAPADQAE